MATAAKRLTAGSAEERILISARHEIEKRGILGLRIMDVARGADASLSLIYKYFNSRDGLLARVLGDMYEEILRQSYDAFMDKVNSRTSLTVRDIAEFLPQINDATYRKNQYMRLNILAASLNNEPLRIRLEDLTKKQHAMFDEGISAIRRHMSDGSDLDSRFFHIVLATQTMYYRELMGDTGFSREEYVDYVTKMLTRDGA